MVREFKTRKNMPFLKDNFERIKHTLDEIFKGGLHIVNLADPLHPKQASIELKNVVILEIPRQGLLLIMDVIVKGLTPKDDITEFHFRDANISSLDEFLFELNSYIQTRQLCTFKELSNELALISPSSFNFVSRSGIELSIKDVAKFWNIPGRTFDYETFSKLKNAALASDFAKNSHRFQLYAHKYTQPNETPGLKIINLGGVDVEQCKHFFAPITGLQC